MRNVVNLLYQNPFMQVYQDLEIHKSYTPDQDLITYIINFSKGFDGWVFLEERSDDYSKGLGEPACVIGYKDNKLNEKIAFFFASRKPNKGIYLTNMIPESSDLNKTEHNTYVSTFIKDLRKFSKAKTYDIRLKIGKAEFDLKDIIKAPKTRARFQFYLNQFPTSYHPLDIKRLDNFICALHRFNAYVNLEYLQSYLTIDLNWKEEDAEWCTKRISTGLSVLRANQVFWGAG